MESTEGEQQGPTQESSHHHQECDFDWFSEKKCIIVIESIAVWSDT